MKIIITTAIVSFIFGAAIMFFITRSKESADDKLEQFLKTSKSHPFTNIGFAAAQHYAKQYKPNPIAPRQNADGSVTIGNTQTVWFDIHTIADLYYLILHTNNGDGVRFYFATYDDKYNGIDSRGAVQNCSNANTLILVPTYTNQVDGKNYHFDVPDNAKGTKKIAFVPGTPGDYENKGELCPPGDCPNEGASLLK